MALNFPSSLDWEIPPSCPQVFKEASRQLTYPLLAQLLAQRLSDPQEIYTYLHPQLSQLKDPCSIPQLKQAAQRLAVAITQKEDILILADYDVDGLTSAALLAQALTQLSCVPRVLIPHRQKDGYGLTASLLKRIRARVPCLLLALDCGTNDAPLIETLKSWGSDCVIIDHHAPQKPHGASRYPS